MPDKHNRNTHRKNEKKRDERPCSDAFNTHQMKPGKCYWNTVDQSSYFGTITGSQCCADIRPNCNGPGCPWANSNNGPPP